MGPNRWSITRMIMQFGNLLSWESPSAIFPGWTLDQDVYNDFNEGYNPHHAENCMEQTEVEDIHGHSRTKYHHKEQKKNESMTHIVNYYVYKKIMADPKQRAELAAEDSGLAELPVDAKRPQIYFFITPTTKYINDPDIINKDGQCIGGNMYTMHEFEYIMESPDIRENITFVIGAYEELYPLLRQVKTKAENSDTIDIEARRLICEKLEELSKNDPSAATVGFSSHHDTRRRMPELSVSKFRSLAKAAKYYSPQKCIAKKLHQSFRKDLLQVRSC